MFEVKAHKNPNILVRELRTLKKTDTVLGPLEEFRKFFTYYLTSVSGLHSQLTKSCLFPICMVPHTKNVNTANFCPTLISFLVSLTRYHEFWAEM